MINVWIIMNKDIANADIKLWRMALRSLYARNIISKSELLTGHKIYFFGNKKLGAREEFITSNATTVLSDMTGLKESLSIEARFIASGELPVIKSDFESHWLSHLAECVAEEYITESEFDEYSNRIDFSSYSYTDDEMNYVEMILDMVRFELLSKNPRAIEFIENPSFELLMFVNRIDW